MFDIQRGSSLLRDKLTGALIGLARATDGNEHLISQSSTAVIADALEVLYSDAGSDDTVLEKMIRRVEAEKRVMVPNCFTCACPCGKNNDYDMENLQNADANVRGLKESILRGIACVEARGCDDAGVERFFYKALFAIGMDDWGVEELQPIVQELREILEIK